MRPGPTGQENWLRDRVDLLLDHAAMRPGPTGQENETLVDTALLGGLTSLQ